VGVVCVYVCVCSVCVCVRVCVHACVCPIYAYSFSVYILSTSQKYVKVHKHALTILKLEFQKIVFSTEYSIVALHD